MHGKMYIVESFIDMDGNYDFREPKVCTSKESALDAIKSDLVGLIVRNPNNMFSEQTEIPTDVGIAENFEKHNMIVIVCDEDATNRLVYKIAEKDMIVNFTAVDGVDAR